jgi:hypothetical protein
MARAVDNQELPNRMALSGERKTSDEALAEIWAEVLRRPHLTYLCCCKTSPPSR